MADYSKPKARPKGDSANEEDLLKEAREAFEQAAECESENRREFIDDIRFARLSEHWPAEVKQQRAREGRPCLVVPRLPTFIRQVVNDSRQNKPSIKVHPCDSKSDPETAEVFNGLIRNIQVASDADVAYDTAIENAVSAGWGYFRIGLDYTHDDSFELDITIDRVPDPLNVFGDPCSKAADSSDWNSAFVVDYLTTDAFKAKYPDAEPSSWDEYEELGEPWWADDAVMVAEWWQREEIDRPIVLVVNDQTGEQLTFDAAQLTEVMDEATGATRLMILQASGFRIAGERTTKTCKVTQRILTGAAVLETNPWPGKYIPIVPVYGDEVVVEGKRYFRSLIRDAKDPQRIFNYWRTAATELVALAPRVPFLGPKGAFVTDAAKWATANTQSHSFLEYDVVSGGAPPQRQQLGSEVPAAAIQQALTASDDMKSVMGLYDASLGARSNETSGKAIMARQREGDVSTFHFIDNLSRAIRHAGRILIDLIPKVYNKQRIVRVLGEDNTPKQVPLGQPTPVTGPDGQPQMQPRMDQNGQPVMQPGPQGQPVQAMDPVTRIYDLTVGKYDLTVSSGPSFTTRRQEAAAEMTELMRSIPDAGPVIGDLLVKNLDWPGADEIAERLKALYDRQYGQPQQGLPPQVQQQMQQGQQQIAQLSQENQQLKSDKTIESQKLQLEQQKLQIEQFKAETDRMQAMADIENARTELLMPKPVPQPNPRAA